MNKVKALISEIEVVLTTITNAAAVAVSSVNPHALPPKEAAILAVVSSNVLVAQRLVLKVRGVTPAVEAVADKAVKIIEHPAALETVVTDLAESQTHPA